MKKFLFSILTLGLSIIFNTINAQCSLDQVGTSAIAITSNLYDMAVSPDGKTYVLAYNASTKNIELRVAPTTNTSWSLVGIVPTVTNTTSQPVMEITKAGEIVIFVRDEGNGKVGKVYHSFGGAITQIGSNLSTGPVTDLAIAFSSTNEIFVSFTDVSLSNVAVVKRWTGSIWSDIGTGGGVASGTSIAHFNSLIIDKANTPVIAYQDGSAGNKITVRKYNGSSWVILTTLGSGSTTNSKLKCANNGDYFLGYTEGSNSIVQTYNGSVWSLLGSPVSGLLTSSGIFDMELDPADVPFIIGAENVGSYIVAYKYNNEATWMQVPSGFINAANSTNTAISFDVKGAPYFSYVDIATNNSINVKTLSLLSSLNSINSPMICNGSAGSLSIAITGTYSPSYQWQTDINGNFLNALSPYATTTTSVLSFTANPSMNQDKIRCVVNFTCRNAISNTATLTVHTPTISLTKNEPSCFGSCNGIITANSSGGVYSWNPSVGTTSVVTGLCAGNYTGTITDFNGCSASSIISLVAPPDISNSVLGNLNICIGSSTTLTLNTVGGTPPYIHNWSPGSSLSSTNTPVTVASPTSTTNYSITTSDINGCSKTHTVTLTVNALPTISTSNSNICYGTSATLSASGANTFTWNPGNLIGAIQNVNPLNTTNYSVVGTNTLTSCTNTAIAIVTVNSLPIANAGPTATLTCLNTATTLTGSGGSTYLWTGPGIVSGSATANPTINAPGVYSLQVTSSGCTSTISTVSINQNTLTPITSSSVSGILNCTLTTVNANVTTTTTPVTYSWTGSGITSASNISTITVNAPGLYNYSVTNTSNGCISLGSVNVSQNSLVPSVSATTAGSITCTTNTIQLNGTPASGVTYSWSAPAGSSIVSGGALQNAVGSGSGVYTLTVRSLSSGCPNSSTVAANQNTNPPTPTASNTTTLTCTTATAILSGIGGGNYFWSGPGTILGGATATPTVNAPGNYTLTVTATNGCSATATTSVSQNNNPPNPTATVSDTLTCATTTISLNGGPSSGVYYVWSGPGIISSTTSQIATANAPGTYTLTITDIINGCPAFTTTIVNQDIAPPNATATSNGSITCTTNTVQLNGSGGAGLNYLWNGPGFFGGNNTQNVIANSSGDFTLTVQSLSNGCSTSATTTVIQNTIAPVGVNAGLDQTLTCSNTTITINGSVSTPTNSIINWVGSGICGSQNTATTIACASGIYTLTATDPQNGCSSFDMVEVFQNIGAPSINVSTSGILDCINTSINIIATTSTSPVSYNWSGPGIIAGSTNSTAIVNLPGTYTITITNLNNSCSTNSFVTVIQDISIPSISVTSSSSVICSGVTTTIIATGANSYSWSPGGQTTNSIVVSPTNTTNYTVSGSGLNGCIGSANQIININTLPNLSINGTTNICKGSSTILTALGAYTYTWNSGANTTSISVSPTITTSYSILGEDINGCINSFTTSVNIITAKDISGIITSTAGASTGDIILYKYTTGLSMWDSLTTVPFSSSFTFLNIDSSKYVLRAIPSATNIQVTYAYDAINWQNAVIINHGCANNTTQNISLVGLDNIGIGPGILSGTITEDSGFGLKTNNEFKPLVPGNPIGGIVVKGGRNPSGNMVVQTTTDATGGYTLSGLPLNIGTESYFVYVDIPGLDTTASYHKIIDNNNTVFQGLNFSVDSMYIKPIGTITNITNNNSLLNNQISVFPNPTSGFVNIKYELIESANIQITLYDMMGKKIKEIIPPSYFQKNNFNHIINTEDIGAGLYLLNFKINNSESMIKLILND